MNIPSWLSFTRPARPKKIERAQGDPAISVDQWLSYFTFGGLQYPFMPQQTLQGNREDIPNNFAGYITGAYRSNGVVFACMLARMLLFSEARFQFRQMRNGRPGDLFGTQELQILENPWPGGVTGDLLARAITDADLSGNFYAVRRGGQIKRLRPDWVTIVIGSKATANAEAFVAGQIDATVLGYAYQPGGPNSGAPIEVIGADEMAHFAPIPDPLASYRGMSWITPILREIMSDSGATTHKMKFFENGATVNMVISLDPSIRAEAFDKWVDKFEEGHQGVLNAYKTLYLGGGAQVQPVGSNFEEMDFKVVQGAGETRIAAAARIPPIIVGLSEGLAASTYSNYNQACRAFGDATLRPLWRNFCGSLANIINVPPRSILWYDDRDIPFLQQDMTDRSKVMDNQAHTIRTLVDAGFEPDSVVQAVMSYDYSLLKHTGLYSVQLQPPGEFGEPGGPATPPAPPTSAGATKPAPAKQGATNGNKAPAGASSQGGSK